jgi:hypothetical protein
MANYTSTHTGVVIDTAVTDVVALVGGGTTKNLLTTGTLGAGATTLGATGVTTLTASGLMQANQASATINGMVSYCTSATFTGTGLQIQTVKAAAADFDLIEAFTSNGGVTAFSVNGQGNVFAAGTLAVTSTVNVTTGGSITAPAVSIGSGGNDYGMYLDGTSLAFVADGSGASDAALKLATSGVATFSNDVKITGTTPTLTLSDNTSPTLGFDRPAGQSYKIENEAGVLRVKGGSAGVANATTTYMQLNGITASFAGDVLPTVTETLDLGSASFEWDNIFLQNAATVSDFRTKNDLGLIENASTFLNLLEPKLFTRKEKVIKEAIPAKTTQVQKTETVKESQTSIEIIEGIPTKVTNLVEVQKPAFDYVQVVDENGKAVPDTVIPAVTEPILNEEGNDTGKVIVLERQRSEPVLHPVPVMIDEVTPEVPEVWSSHSRPHSGFMAQSVKEAMADAGMKDWAGYVYDEDADVHALRLMEFVAYLVAGHKELSARIEALEA